MTWLPCWRSLIHPAFRKARTARSPETAGKDAIVGGNLDFADFNGRRHPMCRTRRKATNDCFTNIFEGLGFRPPLGHAARNRRALDYEHAGFIWLQSH